MLTKLKDKILNFNTILSLSIFILFLFFHFFESPEVVYVDNVKLFEAFNMTKEMKKKGETIFQAQKIRLDSIYSILNKGPQITNEELKNKFILEKNAFEETSQQYALQESDKIWIRLNDYIKDYSSTKGYKIILGSTNQQQVLFAAPETDITDELITFVNKRYEGEN